MERDKIWKGIAILSIVGLILIALISAILLIFTSKPSLSMGSCIGVINIDGPIFLKSQRGGFSQYPGAEDYAEAIRRADRDPTIKGLFVVINSPGGGVVASDIIYRELKRLKKPKVSYIEEVGASGGYYVALGTDRIYSHYNSLVGNIGVIMYIENYEGLMEKIGINITTVKSGRYKDIGNPFRKATQDEIQMILEIVNETYGQFVSILKESRYISEELFENVTDGRIMTGTMAKRMGLVDDVGLKRDFLSKFANELNVPETNICDITPSIKPPSLLFMESLISMLDPRNIYGDRYRLRAE
ncbi:MAG: signal peptide peptidase SppA [Candidatus Micrarchaeota archaeon]|nr:signal peptide peptidase SppA [Candidatus Micrarchaeota archaeon]MCX8154520.1 signal peptide peptidase SppA [Candidatus Micrarchaeota archaeon]